MTQKASYCGLDDIGLPAVAFYSVPANRIGTSVADCLPNDFQAGSVGVDGDTGVVQRIKVYVLQLIHTSTGKLG